MTGHRRRMSETFPHYDAELFCSSQGVVGRNYGGRQRKPHRSLVRKLVRSRQKRQDTREIKEQTTCPTTSQATIPPATCP